MKFTHIACNSGRNFCGTCGAPSDYKEKIASLEKRLAAVTAHLDVYLKREAEQRRYEDNQGYLVR